MNLEEELNLINNQNNVFEGEPTQPVFDNTQGFQQAPYQNNVQPNMFQNNVQPNMFQNNVAPEMNVATAQPSMINPNAAQAETAGYNFSNLDFDPSKPVYDVNPLERLTGNQNEIFRVHFLPGVKSAKVHVHYNAEKNLNFVCLKDLYGTSHEDCCSVYGEAKSRVIIPVVVMPIVTGQPNSLLPGQPARLCTLVLGPSQLIKLQDQAKFAGVELAQCDFIAAVDNPRFKSFNFTIAQNSFISQIPNVPELTNLWQKNATPENICKLAGKMIDRVVFKAEYASYDRSRYEQQKNTPTGGALNVDPNMMAFNNQNPQMSPFGPGYGSPSTPMYQQAPYSPTQTNQGFGGNDNPWSTFN